MNSLQKILFTIALLPASLCAQDAPAASPPQEYAFTQTLVMVALALLFFYFILWRPEQKRRKTMDALRTSMKKGDRVVAVGIVGTISKIKDDTVVIHTGESEIEVLKAAINEVQGEAKA